ncbi:uncharacterized protein LOC5512880 [Nematostella vectensis]|uniref:uncharacterized protein LOC5512880 n=1 Tax=Nematostella vectensis TaxID=45351 RepID=UPI00207792B9|nr:uncharacterized protein LOC5512880 [Nematostella vectensis]
MADSERILIEEIKLCHAIIGNIPSKLHSADLRVFFSQFIEGKGFDCFHFRHRPEGRGRIDGEVHDEGKSRQKTTCCIVRLTEEKIDELIRMYHGQNWTDKTGQIYSQRAVISRIRVTRLEGQNEGQSYKTKAEKKQNTRTSTEFLESDLKKLPELNPPAVMPNGNVGTPISTFIELIRLCKFPPLLIKKLGLTFPRSKTKKYGNVPFDYGDSGELEAEDDEEELDMLPSKSASVSGSMGLQNTKASDKSEDGEKQKCLKCRKMYSMFEHVDEVTDTEDSISEYCKCALQRNQSKESDNREEKIYARQDFPGVCIKSKSHSNQNTKKNNTKARDLKDDIDDTNESSDGELEDWERHEALHDDVDSQGRTKERLFENEIELKWEKGGSGLVWYTDAAFWKQQEEADFDEETVDDWDVDMGIYEEEGGGDKDAKDLLQKRLEKQWRSGKDIDLNQVGDFERFTRGIGGSVMRRQGWSQGQSLGSSQPGITEPVPADGQKPSSKRGLGYYGEKLNRHVKRTRATRDVVIATVFDNPEERSTELYESTGPHAVKYRDSVSFVPASSSSKKS